MIRLSSSWITCVKVLEQGGGDGGMGRELMGPRSACDFLLTLVTMEVGLLGGGDVGCGEVALLVGDIGLLPSGGLGGLRVQAGGVGSSCQEDRGVSPAMPPLQSPGYCRDTRQPADFLASPAASQGVGILYT